MGQGLGGRHPVRDRWDGWDASGLPHVSPLSRASYVRVLIPQASSRRARWRLIAPLHRVRRRPRMPSPTMARSASSHLPGEHTVRSPTSRAVAHRYHVDAVHADHAAYPTVPPSPPPQCTSAGGGREARGMIGGSTSKAAAPAFIGRACLCRRHLTQPSLISDGLSPSSSRCRPASLRSLPCRAMCTPAPANRRSWSSRCSLAPWLPGPRASGFQIGTWGRAARTGGS